MVLNIMIHIPTTSVYKSVGSIRQDESVCIGFNRLLINLSSRFRLNTGTNPGLCKKEMSWPDI